MFARSPVGEPMPLEPLKNANAPPGTLPQPRSGSTEPGKSVIEVRSAGSHKGMVVHRLAAVLEADGFLFAGDDLGDVEAFEAVEELGQRGLATLRVCSASDEQSALVALSDVVVHGPAGVLDLLRQLATDARAARRTS